MDGRSDSSILFMPIGRNADAKSLSSFYGIKDVRNVRGCKEYLSELVKTLDSVMIRFPGRVRYQNFPWSQSVNADQAFKEWLTEQKGSLKFKNLRPILDDMRRVKTPWEIEKMEETCRIAGEAHVAAMKATRPGIWEYQLAAEAKKYSPGMELLSTDFPA